jgi:hypothetical protein
MGGEKLLRLLIGVDVVLGPLITLIIFDPRKPALKWDLAPSPPCRSRPWPLGAW